MPARIQYRHPLTRMEQPQVQQNFYTKPTAFQTYLLSMTCVAGEIRRFRAVFVGRHHDPFALVLDIIGC